ncbi:MAG: DUF4393 domain-containing protein [Candidatus Melainabacteria bacterium]
MSQIKDTAEVVKGIAEAVPVYQDLLQPTVKQVGNTLGETVRCALGPLHAFIWSYDKIANWLEDSLENEFRRRNVKSEEIITPKMSVAGPTIEALRFVEDEFELRNMYARLLATSMVRGQAIKAHPAFVETIKQMNFVEAKLLEFITNDINPQAVDSDCYPLINIKASPVDAPANYVYLFQYFTDVFSKAGCNISTKESSVSILNLRRLELIEIPHGSHLSTDECYQALEQDPFVQKIVNSVPKSMRVRFEKSMFCLTEYGRAFCSACIA